jgi:type VI secretion system secreted protein VgrG
VVVAFEEGDPDKPIILGSVYNAEQMPPYLGDGLDAKHRNDSKVSGIKTCTTPDGNGFNEIRFDDTKGKEQVFIHSQNALDVRVLGSQRTSVGGHYHLTVQGDAREHIHKNKAIQVESDMKTVVLGVSYLFAKGYCYIGSRDNIELHALDSLTVYGSKQMIVLSDAAIGLRCGDSSITLTPKGIWLNGPQVLINSGPPPKVERPEPVATDEIKKGLEVGPFAADDSRPGFVSNPDAARKALPEAVASRSSDRSAGD